MKYAAFIMLALFGMNGAGQGTYVCKNAKVSLYSEAPLEDIEAESVKGVSVLNTATGDIAFSVPVRSFKFEKSLMEEHFNENYMESDKFPQASFKGKVKGVPDWAKNGEYSVQAVGVLEVHGVKQNRTIPGKIVISNGSVRMSSVFMVRCKDHRIDIPTLVFQKIAESIKVTVTADYSATPK